MTALIAEHPICWGAIKRIAQDRNGEDVGQCDKCGTYFYTGEVNRDGHDMQCLKEFGPEDEV
jgi:hypothetical protein